jgi:SlyX protein
MSDLALLTQRLNEVEARLTHQEETIRELSDVSAAQWQLIEALQRRVAELTGSIRAGQSGAASGADEPPPPHY